MLDESRYEAISHAVSSRLLATVLARHLAALGCVGGRLHYPRQRELPRETSSTGPTYSATAQMAGQRQQGCPVAACGEDGVTDAARQVSCCTARHVDEAVMTSLCLMSRLLSLAARCF